jgi:hydroxyacyl-ACP dehydratase HTD2-like protein with hotdog domain
LRAKKRSDGDSNRYDKLNKMRATAIAKGLSPYLTVEALKTRIGSAAIKRSEELHVHPANQLQITLQHLKLFPTPELKLGDLLPPIYHFLYFLPRLTENQLSSDGGDPTFNAGGDFVRRMWAGGDFAWVTSNPLRFGQTVTETTGKITLQNAY